ncbi:MAG: HD domain-containing protein [Gammaproteobacteria bacterium]|uniref:HD domain-containing protein n=1 Tax=Marinomonas TaxID=28253 RepID=UPI000C1DCBB2|nr:HD domain-containing protein [Marinomonas sp. BSi20584]MBU1297150.1 HD domain-containing protein [Gammaproteobacteria bacterium]MBU1466570.1 HD domain-containing protein [Gammaproteobacteria bacterium]MBU2236380.1 HD domain-containing protein [Gammaproteobacteria bacterium]MBU2318099.1 HD domain-containing protein [Gammaproteobacteria bacterium]MBU2414377.1 HD domain-containing protein [Gammaproteobacteria bacterium]
MPEQLNDQTLDKQFAFLCEIDQLKSVIRKSPLIDKSRRENSAEHSWHLAMYALILKDSSDKEINIERVIKMLLIHDIVEIDAGDHPIHETVDNTAQEEAEQKAGDRLFGLLPTSQGEELKALWYEFEAAETNDAVFAKSLDRLQPLIHNVATNGGTWIEGNVSHEQVKQRYGSVISAGSKRIWNLVQKLVGQYFHR